MNLDTFRQHIRTVNQTTLNAYHDQITAKFRRARLPASRLNWALALDELCIESERRQHTTERNTQQERNIGMPAQ